MAILIMMASSKLEAKIVQEIQSDGIVNTSRTFDRFDHTYNAVMDNWNGMLKTEWYDHPAMRRDKKLLAAEQAKKEILAYVDYWNNDRIQTRLKYRFPKKFKKAISQGGV